MRETVKICLLKHVQYGRERLYPGCDLSKAIMRIKGKKTFTDEDATILSGIGKCEIEITPIKERPKDKK